MSNSAPGSIVDPYKLAKNQQALQGSIAVADMPRGSKLVASDQGEVVYSIKFAPDMDGRCVIAGELQAKLAFRCQRCLQPFWQELSCSFAVSPVPNDEEAKLLISEYEPVIVTDAKLDVVELLEDELILAMPIVAMHDSGQCEVAKLGPEVTGEKPQELEHPFQVLQNLKLNKKAQQAEDKNGGTTES